MALGRSLVTVELGDLRSTILKMRRQLTPEQFNRLMHDTLYDAGRRAKTIVKRAASKDYAVGPNWIGGHIGRPKMSGGGSETTATVPVNGVRGILGPRYKLAGRIRPTKAKGKRYKISARILRGKVSTLPSVLPHQGGNAPFVATGNGGVRMVFTRHDRKMVRVPGVAVPQMITNQSEDEIQDELLDYIEKRLDHHFERMLRGF